MADSRYPSAVIVRYRCGCIGFPPDLAGHALILKVCDVDMADLGEGHCFMFRGGFSPTKIVESLSASALGKLVAEISGLIGDGKALHEIQRLLIPPTKRKES